MTSKAWNFLSSVYVFLVRFVVCIFFFFFVCFCFSLGGWWWLERYFHHACKILATKNIKTYLNKKTEKKKQPRKYRGRDKERKSQTFNNKKKKSHDFQDHNTEFYLWIQFFSLHSKLSTNTFSSIVMYFNFRF